MSEALVIAIVGIIGGVVGAVITGLSNFLTAYIGKDRMEKLPKEVNKVLLISGAFVGVVLAVLLVIVWQQVNKNFVTEYSNDVLNNNEFYYNFEEDLDDNWISDGKLSISDKYSFFGNSSLEATVSISETQDIRLKRPFTAETIVGRIYWENDQGFKISYAQVCVVPSEGEWACENIPKKIGSWNTFVIKLSKAGEKLQNLSTSRLEELVIRVYTEGEGTEYPALTTIYVDALEIW